jgi:hypothetical protein
VCPNQVLLEEGRIEIAVVVSAVFAGSSAVRRKEAYIETLLGQPLDIGVASFRNLLVGVVAQFTGVTVVRKADPVVLQLA